jgi:hypothetical protein
MKLSASTVVIAVMAVIIAVLCWALVYFARDELKMKAERGEDEIPTRSALAEKEGFAAVKVSPESQKASGIVTAALAAARSEAAAEVYGVVVNLQPLYDLRGKYLAGTADAGGLRAALASSRAQYERAKKLYADERNVSERVLQTAEAQWRGDQARLQAAEQSLQSLRESMLSNWGAVITQWATGGRAAEFEALGTRQRVVVQIALPHDLSASAGKAALTIAPVTARSSQRSAHFLSASPQSDGTAAGVTYFYLADGHGLRTGMRVAGRLKLGSEMRTGIAVPEAAVVWHGGRAWAYVKEDASTFLRKPVSTAQDVPGGWFNADGFDEGEQVVVSGAQLLLSEEMKFQIRNENED